MINLLKVVRSFRFAGAGILALFRYENNARVHLLAASGVVAVSFWLQLNRIEWAIILTQIGLVWAAEGVNTAIEKLCDLVSPGYHPQVKAIKDLSAGAVLLVVLVAVVVGSLLIGMKLYTRFQLFFS
ncbi:diacylglycerol kinase family protein [Arsenicibacter rosenii]|uniref:Diacylglycerol kinase n=1 Tax=Arsenicibacter rosenii TaxID=1750698 RepID=A0A1S2VIK7_9BACT|nr:diacylglycerol kinase family protein [Arsenicibacter rosenii]OIN58584.1 diacylglycerol kinase [Arsenicibacter rosenii]